MARARTYVLALVTCLHGAPGHADNIWGRTVIPTGPATYAVSVSSVPAPRETLNNQSLPDPALLVAAPNFNGWRNGPLPGPGGGSPLLCAFGRLGFSFGF